MFCGVWLEERLGVLRYRDIAWRIETDAPPNSHGMSRLDIGGTHRTPRVWAVAQKFKGEAKTVLTWSDQK